MGVGGGGRIEEDYETVGGYTRVGLARPLSHGSTEGGRPMVEKPKAHGSIDKAHLDKRRTCCPACKVYRTGISDVNSATKHCSSCIGMLLERVGC